VIYPPVEILKESRVQKEKRIVILGRFSPAKKQHELIQLFLRSKERLPNWKLVCIGSKDPDCHYFKQIEQMVDSRVCLLPNASRSVVFDELNRASVFWHAMGLNVDENANPLMIEHFGISTVEAMAAGCIPITVNKGGQREIVTHNVNGFLCDTLDDFVDYSCEVDQKPELSNRLGHAAKSDVLRFDRPNFENAVLARLGL
jgi:glycosyltransferase involved in cell wall biosynthesis